MGELKSRAESLERRIIEIVRELNRQRDEVSSLAGDIRYLAEKAEKFEDENAEIKKQMDDQRKDFDSKLKQQK